VKFTCTTEINLPIRKVVELYVNKNNLKEWQKELISYDHISGIPEEVGAVTRLKYKSVTIFETITFKNIAFEINGEYEHKRSEKTILVHKASNRFSSLKENRTLYEMEIETIKIFGILPKLMSLVMGGAAKKYYQNLLYQFKKFAEKTYPDA